ncbi:MAG: serine/threonine protein kinase [Magnetococcales bacterium]|nr:serine/threonine protein kinase [Magnetococcales bacterium]NGZ27088.1 serine/threonine protein kinase [Magnetococcales bacterium]
MKGRGSNQAFHQLGPDEILNAIDSVGFLCDGRLLALNSFENRVYQVGMEEGGFLVAKFYRAGRWSDEAILEEHRFTHELAEAELPAIAPIERDGTTLFHAGPHRFALYPRRGGRCLDLESHDQLLRMGHFLGRMHGVAATRTFLHRPTLDPVTFGREPVDYLLENHVLPGHLEGQYQSLANQLLQAITACYQRAGSFPLVRIHGDCHHGNLLWNDDGPQVLDFDDARMGPAIQDLWMCLPGNRQEQASRLDDLLEGYEVFYTFNEGEMYLIEALRTLRVMHYAAWIAQRWEDPAFPRAFPWFQGDRYWEGHLHTLKEQLRAMEHALTIIH